MSIQPKALYDPARHNCFHWLSTWISFECLVHNCSNSLLIQQCSKVFGEAIPWFNRLKVQLIWSLWKNFEHRIWLLTHKFHCMFHMNWWGIVFRMEYRLSVSSPLLNPNIHHCTSYFLFRIQAKIVLQDLLNYLTYFFALVHFRRKRRSNMPMLLHKGLAPWLRKPLHSLSSQNF